MTDSSNTSTAVQYSTVQHILVRLEALRRPGYSCDDDGGGGGCSTIGCMGAVLIIPLPMPILGGLAYNGGGGAMVLGVGCDGGGGY